MNFRARPIRVSSDAAHENLPLDFNVFMTAEQQLELRAA
jgi:hypothetical protein